MKRIHVWVFTMLMASMPLAAQHPFYTQLLQEGENAMALKNWDKAHRYLEIAAFGLLEHSDHLATANMRMAIVADKLKDKEASLGYITKVRRIQPNGFAKPEALSVEHWDSFQVLVGLKKPPAPPMPKDVAGLQSYIKNYPEIEKAWVSLIRAQGKERNNASTRTSIEKARLAHPRSTDILTEALRFSVNRDRSRDAGDIAKDLLALKADSSLACEILGNEAVKAKKYKDAKSYYENVRKAELSETTTLKRRMTTALDRLDKEAERERQRKEKAAKQKAEAERVAKEKALADARKKEEDAKRLKAAKDAADAKALKDAEAKAARLEAKRKDQETRKTAVKPKPAPKASEKKDRPKKVTPKPVAKKTEPKPSPLKLAQKAVTENPKDVEAKYRLLDLYFQTKNLRKAKSILKTLGEVDARSANYAGAFAQYNYLKRKYKLNVKNLGKLRTLGDRARYYLGMSYYKLGEMDEAREILEPLDRKQWPDLDLVDRTLKQNPAKKRSAKAPLREDAPTLVRTQDKEETQRILRSGSLDERLGVFAKLMEKGDWNMIRRPIRKAYSEAPRNQDVLYCRARLYLQEGDYKRASNIFYNLSSNGYKKGEVFYYGGLSAYRNNDTSMAIYLFRRAKTEETIFMDEVEKYLNEEKPLRVDNRDVASKIKELEARVRTTRQPELRFALMRMYAVSGNESGFDKMKDELQTQRLTESQRDLLLSWNLCKFDHFDRALTILDKYDNPEAIFLRGYIYLQNGQAYRGVPLLSSLKDNKFFPEVPFLLE